MFCEHPIFLPHILLPQFLYTGAGNRSRIIPSLNRAAFSSRHPPPLFPAIASLEALDGRAMTTVLRRDTLICLTRSTASCDVTVCGIC